MKNIYQLNVKILNLLFAILGFYSIGCKKFVQIGPPTTQLATTSVFSTSAAATSAQLAIYIKMYQNQESWYLTQATGLLSDELKNYSSTAALVQYYTNAMSALNSPGPWNNAYYYIYQANAIIGGVQNNANIPAPIAAQLLGESKFIRAFWNFYLTNIYGDVPLVMTTNYSVNGSMTRTPKVQIYQQIVSDLRDAYTNLNANYVDATDTAITADRVRPTKGAAAAMLARVYLYTQRYDSAEMEASSVINNSSIYNLCTNLSSTMGTNYVFQRGSSEAIWQLATPIPSSYFTWEGFNFYLKGAPGKGNNSSATISPQLLNSFEPNDMRMGQWIGVYKASSTVKYYFPYKYHTYNTAATSSAAVTEYTMVLRLAEQFLIRAEARAQQGNGSGAIADLNVIRNRAGLPNYSGSTDQASILAAILHERQVELFSEWGHRWFDLKRTGNIDGVMGSPGGVCQAKGGSWSSSAQLYPIPQSELNNDAHLSQNSGY